MRARYSLWLVLLLLAGSLALAACGSDDEAKDDTKISDKSDDHKKPEKKVEPPTPICPQVAVVRELDTVRDVDDNSNDPAKLIAGAKLLSVTGDCEYPDDGGIDVAFHLNMIAKRGPRLGGLHQSFPFFVAVVDPQGNILNKNMFTAEISFASDTDYTNHDEALHVFVPLPKDQRATGPYYRVLSGFQLSPDQAQVLKKAQ